MIKNKIDNVYDKYKVMNQTESMKKIWKDVDELKKADFVKDYKESGVEFTKSPEGQKTIQKWNDFGAEIRKGLSKESDGSIKLKNSQIDKASVKFDEFVDYLDELEDTKWGEDWHTFIKELKKSKELSNLKYDYGKFILWSDWSDKKERKAKFDRAIAELKDEVNQQVEVTDLPTSSNGKKLVGHVENRWDKFYKDEYEDLKREQKEAEESAQAAISSNIESMMLIQYRDVQRVEREAMHSK